MFYCYSVIIHKCVALRKCGIFLLQDGVLKYIIGYYYFYLDVPIITFM